MRLYVRATIHNSASVEVCQSLLEIIEMFKARIKVADHAGRHNHFFKNNYLFKQRTDDGLPIEIAELNQRPAGYDSAALPLSYPG